MHPLIIYEREYCHFQLAVAMIKYVLVHGNRSSTFYSSHDGFETSKTLNVSSSAIGEMAVVVLLVPELNTIGSPQGVEVCMCDCFQYPQNIGSHTPTSGHFRFENCFC